MHLLLGDLPNAVASFEQALRVDPEHPGAHIGAMWRAKLGGTIEETEEHARRALASGGERAAVVERVGEVWESLGEYERALAVFERGAEDHPEHEALHMRLAIQYARFGDQERAQREREAAGKAAADVNLRNRLGIAYAARRDFAQAEPIFRDILKERPDEPSTRRFLARMLRETGREAEAASLVEGRRARPRGAAARAAHRDPPARLAHAPATVGAWPTPTPSRRATGTSRPARSGWRTRSASTSRSGRTASARSRALAPAPGERVLDLGCGCGDSSLALARRVAPGGRVLGLDLSEPMLARARSALPRPASRTSTSASPTCSRHRSKPARSTRRSPASA